MAKLVIVESPAKARTIEKYLGKEFKVAASVGHIVDLPRKDLGVDLEHDFKPVYEVMPEKRKAVAALKKAAQNADEIFLAPDPDREGEAIAWHIAKLLEKSGKPIHRVLINEITKPAVIRAIEEATQIDQNRFEAQQARRILDRLVGYKISPLLSRKLRGSLSAGRVQSVALRLVVDREDAIRRFEAKEYWSIESLLAAKAPPKFKAHLASISGKGLELPQRFDKETNDYVPINEDKHVHIKDEADAKSIVDVLKNNDFIVQDIKKWERKRNPLPPFITSTLQQEAARRLGFSAKKTMMLAQRLYEGQDVGEGAVGLITYMRTDSPRVANQALDMARDYIHKTYGDKYLPPRPRTYKSKKSAQEAHEAVRVTSADRTPDQVKQWLDRDLFRLYELIFLRFIASQMATALYDQTTVEIPVGKYLFRAGGRVMKFKGFLAVYEESTEDEIDKGEDAALPELKIGDKLSVKDIIPEQHFTKPPPRFTEASLVKELEERGIGRPSTYASILSTIQDRKYVIKEQKRFEATPLGERVTSILVAAFPDILEASFTAKMEDDLDKVEEGKENWVKLLHRFYGPFSKRLEEAGKIIDSIRQEIPTDIDCPECGRELVIKWSKRGEFLGCSAYPECSYITNFDRDDKGEIVPKERVKLDVPCPDCGKELLMKEGSRGEFLGCSGYPECKFTSNFSTDESGKITPVIKEDEDTGIVCEKCEKPMVIKVTWKGNREFLGCSGYPECKSTSDFIRDEDGKIKAVKRKDAKDGSKGQAGEPIPDEPPCEKCGKPMVMKKGRYGPFKACSGYPGCKNIRKTDKKAGPKKGDAAKKSGAAKKTKAAKKDDAPKKPAPEILSDEPPCEKCGKPMVMKKGRYGPFTACSGYPGCKNIRKKD